MVARAVAGWLGTCSQACDSKIKLHLEPLHPLRKWKEDVVPSAIRSGEFQGKTSSICSAGLSIDQVIHYSFFYSQHSARIETIAANYMILYEVFGKISPDSLQNWGHDHWYNLLPNVSIPVAPFNNISLSGNPKAA